MCGIAAICGGKGPGAIMRVRHMLEKLEHRGRPGTQFEIEEFEQYECVLGTNRLPIVDETGGRQPKQSITGSITLIMNGEIFNYLDLQERLQNEGHISLSNGTLGDTATLANALDAWGLERTLGELSWEGAFVAIDVPRNRIIAARDHLGIKPLYFSFDGGELFLASEISPLLTVCNGDVHPVPPGAAEIFDLKDIYSRYSYQWWDIENYKAEGASADIDRKLLGALRRSVAARVPQGPYAVLLSGGLDSSLILRLAIETNSDATAFVLFTPGSSDLPFARELCSELGVRLVEVKGADPATMNHNISHLVHCVESWEWHVLSHSEPMDALFSAVRLAGHKVVLTGEGADELFCGYNQLEAQSSAGELEAERLRRLKDLHRTNCRRLDRMGMRHGLECRVPFLDKDLVVLALSVDPLQCVDRVTNKIPLKRIAVGLISDRIINRKKLSLAKGAGYRQARSESLPLPKAEIDPAAGSQEFESLGFLPRYPIEELYLRTFLNQGFGRAKYLLSRSM